MRFIVKVFCELAKGIVLGERELNQLKYRQLKPDGVVVRQFDSWGDLVVYIRSFDYISNRYSRLPHNHLLNAIMCNEKDSKRYGMSFDRYRNEDSNWFLPNWYCGFLVADEKGRIYDLRNYVKEIYEFDLEGYLIECRREKLRSFEIKNAIREAKWELDGKLREGKPYWSYYRRIGTTPERRIAAAIEYKPFIRGKRSFSSLPNSWDDFYFHREKNWKARNKKARKQYMVNKRSHIETGKLLPKWDLEYFEDFEDCEEYELVS